jgi:hypothetical protein
MLRGATFFSFCLLLILRRRRFRQGRENLAYSLLAATAATPIHQVMAIELAVWTAIVRRLQLRLRGRKMDKTGRSMNERRVAVLLMMETSTETQTCSVNSIWDAAATLTTRWNNGQDRQVHEGVEGDHLVVDGDIDIMHPVSPRRHS